MVRQSQAEHCSCLRRDWPRGCEGWDCSGKCLWSKDRQPWKQEDTAESGIGGGAVTIASLFPHAGIGSWTILSARRTGLQHRTAAKGAPLCAWCAERQRRTPGKGARCLSGQSYGERPAKEAFSSPAARGLKNDSDTAVTPVAEAAPAHLVLPQSRWPKQLHHLHAQPSLGRGATGKKKKKSLASIHAGLLQLCPTLCDIENCGLVGFSVRGVSSQEYWSLLANTGCHTLLEHILLP